MKKYFLLILLALTSSLSYSQPSTLSPDKVLIQSKDTLLCWNLPKSRIIAKKIIRLSYCDSISSLQQEKITAMDTSINVQARFIGVLKQEKDNLNSSLTLKGKEEINLNTIIKEKNSEIKKQKSLKWLGFIGVVLLGGIAIAK